MKSTVFLSTINQTGKSSQSSVCSAASVLRGFLRQRIALRSSSAFYDDPADRESLSANGEVKIYFQRHSWSISHSKDKVSFSQFYRLDDLFD